MCSRRLLCWNPVTSGVWGSRCGGHVSLTCAGLAPVPSTQLPWEQLCTRASSAEVGPSPPDPAVPTPSFHTQDTLQGPFLKEVLGLEARQDKRNYWQLLTAPNISLQMGEWWVGIPGEVAGVPHSPMAAVSAQTLVPLSTGIADYRPRDEEMLILRLSEW